MKLWILVGVVGLLLLAGCITTTQKCICECPHKEAKTYIFHPNYPPIPITVDKGFFNKDKEGENWISTEEWERRQKGKDDEDIIREPKSQECCPEEGER